MTEEIEEKIEHEYAGNILLPDDSSYLITRVGSDYSKDLNVTYRWPRKIGDSTIMLVATTTLSASSLRNIRLEELDGQYFITNECNHGEQLKISVESAAVGQEIIKGIIDEYDPKYKSEKEQEKDDLDLPKEYWRVNKIAEEFAPLIMVSCAVLLSISAAFWLIFK